MTFTVAIWLQKVAAKIGQNRNERTNGPVNAHLLSWPSKAQNIPKTVKYMVKK